MVTILDLANDGVIIENPDDAGVMLAEIDRLLGKLTGDQLIKLGAVIRIMGHVRLGSYKGCLGRK